MTSVPETRNLKLETENYKLTTVLALLLFAGCSTIWTAGEVPFVPTPPEVVDRMLELAEVKRGDVLYDLGSGDGRVVIRAAKKYGVKAVGVEIDPDLVQRSRAKAKDEGVDHLVEFREQDALTVDVSPASVVTLYMLPEFNAKLRPIFDRQLRSGSRVVSHDFGIDGWIPIKVEKMDGGWYHTHFIYLWKVP
ncbi:MAG TPA: methyltransferase domain-containing protein [Candidatus Binatia bacterium]|jgi:SAM-dependent methyltransferase|nr:methyltransferase domain-containing protein [Candidatus Binatia bacterium]